MTCYLISENPINFLFLPTAMVFVLCQKKKNKVEFMEEINYFLIYNLIWSIKPMTFIIYVLNKQKGN